MCALVTATEGQTKPGDVDQRERDRVTTFTWIQYSGFCPYSIKKQYANLAVYMTNKDEHSTIIPIHMQLCTLQLT